VESPSYLDHHSLFHPGVPEDFRVVEGKDSPQDQDHRQVRRRFVRAFLDNRRIAQEKRTALWPVGGVAGPVDDVVDDAVGGGQVQKGLEDDVGTLEDLAGMPIGR
jgi:hypothetical protein